MAKKCCDANLEVDKKVEQMDNKILLMGNPNVGKSVIFSSLTGMYVVSSNFAGTTVTYTSAKMTLGGKEFKLIDVPGTYSLNATSEAEQVATKFMESGAKAVICVLDATNLTRNLNLAFELLAYNVPMVFALNLVDIAERKGIEVKSGVLANELGKMVIPTIAVKEQGFGELKDALCHLLGLEKESASTDSKNTTEEAKDEAEVKVVDKTDTVLEQDATSSCGGSCSGCKSNSNSATTPKEIWEKSDRIVKKCVTYKDKKPTFLDKLGEKMTKPLTGVPIALLIMVLALAIIVFGGKMVRIPFRMAVDNAIVPFFRWSIGAIPMPTVLNSILIGEYGLFVVSFEWIIGLILPYVAVFYLVFTFLEDFGFLPRMAVLFDGIMRKMGAQGGSLISLMMGYGCAVPAIIGTRTATSKKERIIVTAMVCFAVPCISQTGSLIGLFSELSVGISLALTVGIFLLSFVILFFVGFITSKIVKGKVDPMVIEIPNLLLPQPKTYFKKYGVRMKSFFLEAEGPMLIAVVFASVLTSTGLLTLLAGWAEPAMQFWLGLPGEETMLALILGVIRREMSVAAFQGIGLSPLQYLVAGVVSLLYMPCISVFGIIAKEINFKTAIAIFFGTFISAIFLGGVVNWIGQFIIYIF